MRTGQSDRVDRRRVTMQPALSRLVASSSIKKKKWTQRLRNHTAGHLCVAMGLSLLAHALLNPGLLLRSLLWEGCPCCILFCKKEKLCPKHQGSMCSCVAFLSLSSTSIEKDLVNTADACETSVQLMQVAASFLDMFSLRTSMINEMPSGTKSK
jgi:hypothetical protein